MISLPQRSPQPPGKPFGLMVNVEGVSAILTLEILFFKKQISLKYCPKTLSNWADGATHRSSSAVGNCAFLHRQRLRIHTPLRHDLKPTASPISARVLPNIQFMAYTATHLVVALSKYPSSNFCLRYVLKRSKTIAVMRQRRFIPSTHITCQTYKTDTQKSAKLDLGYLFDGLKHLLTKTFHFSS